MSKKLKSSQKKKSPNVQVSQADRLLNLVFQQILEEDFTGAVTNGERLLKFLPSYSPLRVDVLEQLGTAHAMLQNYPRSYEVLTEALELAPNNADLWYNRGLSSQFTARFGRAFKDFTNAVELNKTPELSEQFDKALKFGREIATKSIKLRGPNFTVEQLIEQEEHFQHGLKLMEEGQWKQAGQEFEASIAMGDCLPQPWGNLGICLLMQELYDEAEAALKRALAIDPKYTLAKNNLAKVSESRRTGPPEILGMQDPFRTSKLKQSITFVKKERQ